MADKKLQNRTDSDNPEIVLEAVGLTKIFRDFWNRPKAKAVNDIDFQVFRGEVLGILGPNGSGKSTTIKMILGLLFPTGGTISVFGSAPTNVKIKKRIGYLPEETYLYKYLTAMETLDFFGSLFNIPGVERKKRCHQLLEMVGLTHAANRPVGEFSKGMARRIGIAQAMINDPELLILDEPTSGLDPIGCREIKDLISLLKSRGKTVIVCSHLLSDVESVCDRVIIMYGGKIRAVGALSELLSVADINTFSVPSLTMEKTVEVLGLLRKYLHTHDIKVSHPKKSLEDYFLEVIEKAREDQVETSGASSGGKIAAYLQDEEDSSSDEILSELAESEPEPEDDTSRQNESVEENPTDDQTADQSLNNLLGREPEEDAEETDDAAEEKEDLSQVNDKLKDLLK